MSNKTWAPHMEPFTSKNSNKQIQNIAKKGTVQLKNFIEDVKLYKTHQRSIEPKIKRRFKTMVIYRLIRNNSCIYKTYRRTNLKQFKEHLNINDSKAKIIGFTPDYKGIAPAKPIKVNNIISKYFYNNRNILKQKYNKTYISYINTLNKERKVFAGGYDSSSLHLNKFFTPNDPNLTEEQIINILAKSNFKWFNAPICTFNDKEELYFSTNYNPKSKSGHYTSKLLKAKSRRETVSISTEVAMKLYDLVKQKPFMNYYLWEILGREKDIKLTSDNKYDDVSARIVLSTEEPATLLLCNYAQKITAALNTVDNKFDVKEKFSFTKYFKYEGYNTKYDYYLDADWSNFDANVETVFIKVAMAILLSSISNIDKEHCRISFYIMSSMITKFVLVPPGVVVKLTKGVPSGSPFTTLCNCYVNIIYWSLIGYEIYGDNYADNMELTVYGDDALVWFKYDDKLLLIDEIVSKIGIKSEKLVNRLYPCKLQGALSDKPDFLKRHFDYYTVEWNRDKMMERLLYQTDSRSVKEQYQLFKSYVETAPFDDEINDLFTDFSNYILKYYIDELDEVTIDEINNINLIISKAVNNYGFKELFRPNKGYYDDIALTIRNIEVNVKRYKESMKVQNIKRSDIDILLILGMPHSFLNEYYKVKVLELLKYNNITFMNMNHSTLESPSVKVNRYINECFKPP